MTTYTLYFELFGKKMKTEIKANTKEAAIEKLKSKLTVLKVEQKVEDSFIADFFNNLKR